MVMTVFFLVLGLALVLLVVGAMGGLSRVTRTASRTFRCPIREQQVTADFNEEIWGGPPFDVVRCTGLAPSTAIRCGKPCLALPSVSMSAERSSQP